MNFKIKFAAVAETDGSSYEIPYAEIDSGKPGPSVLITAALHGTEVQGVETALRFIPQARRHLSRGRCVLAPFANLRAIQKHQPHIEYEVGKKPPPKGVNINTVWPGKLDGTSAERAAAALKKAVVDQATHLIDLHSWNWTWAAGVLARTGYEPSLKLARASSIRFASHSAWKPECKQRPIIPCTLTSYFNDTDRAAICIEFSGQNLLLDAEIKLGLRALRNCLRSLKMFPGALEKDTVPQVWVNDAEVVDVFAPQSGLFRRMDSKLGAYVRSETSLGRLFSDTAFKCRLVRSPVTGYVQHLGCLRSEPHYLGDHHAATHPYAAQGEKLARVLIPKQK